MNQICSNCWWVNDKITYNVNGRCDVCFCTSWQDMNNWPAPKYQLFYTDLTETVVGYYSYSIRKTHYMDVTSYYRHSIYSGLVLDTLKDMDYGYND
jgi:hypothetical protein